jgi:hypothetical protein
MLCGAVMKLFPALLAVGLALGGAFLAKGKPPETTAASMLGPVARTGQPSSDGRYLLWSGDDLACAVVRGKAAGDGAYMLSADADCERLLPGLSKVRFWQERDDAVVVFSRDGIDDLVTFAVADGVAYESFRPASALISVVAAD